MKPNENRPSTDPPSGKTADGYSPPQVTFLGTLADLTQQKEVGTSDGTVFLGVDLGS